MGDTYLDLLREVGIQEETRPRPRPRAFRSSGFGTQNEMGLPVPSAFGTFDERGPLTLPRQMRPPQARANDPRLASSERTRARDALTQMNAANETLARTAIRPPSNQFVEAGRGAAEVTGVAPLARVARDFNTGDPGTVATDALMGGLGLLGTFGAPGLGRGRPAPRPAAESRLRVYHGSPHEFDRFDTSRIGTGEGAQAFGHGLYVAESPDVAQSYRDVFSGKTFTGHETGPAYLYEGYLSGRPSEFIDLDTPIHKQPPPVRRFMSELYDLPESELRRRGLKPVIIGPEEASRAQQAGFAGLRYLDEHSRSGGDGTRNYVVFDPGRVSLDVRNGAPLQERPDASAPFRMPSPPALDAANTASPPQRPPPAPADAGRGGAGQGGVVFHGTNDVRAAGIRQAGFQAGPDGYVWFSGSPETASAHARSQSGVTGSRRTNPEVLQGDVSSLNLKRIDAGGRDIDTLEFTRDLAPEFDGVMIMNAIDNGMPGGPSTIVGLRPAAAQRVKPSAAPLPAPDGGGAGGGTRDRLPDGIFAAGPRDGLPRSAGEQRWRELNGELQYLQYEQPHGFRERIAQIRTEMETLPRPADGGATPFGPTWRPREPTSQTGQTGPSQNANRREAIEREIERLQYEQPFGFKERIAALREELTQPPNAGSAPGDAPKRRPRPKPRLPMMNDTPPSGGDFLPGRR